jgi:hypothetical protein
MKSQLPRGALYGGLLVVAFACVQPQAHRLGVASAGAAPASAASPVIKSGYALDGENCGQAPSAFPKIRIGMRPGYCAGLVASKEDGLVFPRSIVQVPDSQLFVVSDMGGWSAGMGRLLLLDPQAPAGKRVTVLIGKLDFPHGLAVGIDRRIYASTDTKIFRFDPLAKRPETTMEDEAMRGGRGREPARVDLGVHAATQRNFSGVETWRRQPAPRSLRARPAQFDGACAQPGFPGGGIGLPAGRECPRSAGPVRAQ